MIFCYFVSLSLNTSIITIGIESKILGMLDSNKKKVVNLKMIYYRYKNIFKPKKTNWSMGVSQLTTHTKFVKRTWVWFGKGQRALSPKPIISPELSKGLKACEMPTVPSRSQRWLKKRLKYIFHLCKILLFHITT